MPRPDWRLASTATEFAEHIAFSRHARSQDCNSQIERELADINHACEPSRDGETLAREARLMTVDSTSKYLHTKK